MKKDGFKLPKVHLLTFGMAATFVVGAIVAATFAATIPFLIPAAVALGLMGLASTGIGLLQKSTYDQVQNAIDTGKAEKIFDRMFPDKNNSSDSFTRNIKRESNYKITRTKSDSDLAKTFNPEKMLNKKAENKGREMSI